MRCFVACELDEAAKAAIGELQSKFSGLDRAVRWTRPDQMHLTLKFLGQVPEARVPAVARAVQDATAGCQPFRFRIAGLGCFPPTGRMVRIVWIGVQEDGGLQRCFEAVEVALWRLGFAREPRAFTPHLTIGRVKDGSASSAIRHQISAMRFAGYEQAVSHLVLFESRLSSGGASYTVVCREALAGAAV